MASSTHNGVTSFVSQCAGKCILSVDDEPMILMTREEILKGAGYRVLSVPDGDKALEFFAGNSIDLVLLDYRLPDIDGGRVAEEMKKQKPDLPIIIVSAYVDDVRSIARADSFVQKGEHPAFLLREIERLLILAERS